MSEAEWEEAVEAVLYDILDARPDLDEYFARYDTDWALGEEYDAANWG